MLSLVAPWQMQTSAIDWRLWSLMQLLRPKRFERVGFQVVNAVPPAATTAEAMRQMDRLLRTAGFEPIAVARADGKRDDVHITESFVRHIIEDHPGEHRERFARYILPTVMSGEGPPLVDRLLAGAMRRCHPTAYGSELVDTDTSRPRQGMLFHSSQPLTSVRSSSPRTPAACSSRRISRM